jgi:hypothetical protein
MDVPSTKICLFAKGNMARQSNLFLLVSSTVEQLYHSISFGYIIYFICSWTEHCYRSLKGLPLPLYSQDARAAGFCEYGRRCAQQNAAEIVGHL